MKFTTVDLIPHHIHLLRVRYPVAPMDDNAGALADLVMDEPYIGVEQYRAGGTKHLLIGTIEYDELDEDVINAQVQIHDNDDLGLGSIPAPERPGDLIGIMAQVPLVTTAQCYVELSFPEPAGGNERAGLVFPLPYSLAHVEDTPIDEITGIRGVKKVDGGNRRAYGFILDRTEGPETTLSIDFEMEGALAADTLRRAADRASEIATSLGLRGPEERPRNDTRSRPQRHGRCLCGRDCVEP
ncbi:MAG TPA: hypothetical protein VM450_03590 [Thermomicrobiales bacterium]|nr:hypothetical protein [Thermomicrobiales bacterium]